MLRRVKGLESEHAKMRPPSKLSQLKDQMSDGAKDIVGKYEWFVKDVAETLRDGGSVKAFFLPMLCVYFAETTSLEAKLTMAMGIMFIMYLGMKAVKWMESSEWRQKLRTDAKANQEEWDANKAKAKEKV